MSDMKQLCVVHFLYISICIIIFNVNFGIGVCLFCVLD